MHQRQFFYLLLILFLPATLFAAEAPLSLADMVKEATRQSAAKHHIELLTDGNVRVPAPLQAIEALVAPRGVTVTSTSKSEAGSFAIRAASLGRGEHREGVLPGKVSLEKDLARIVHASLIEELTTSAAGVRQDFIVPVAPAGAGDLILELAFTGVSLKTKEQAIALALPGGRELLYRQLKVTDSSSRTLPARFELVSVDRLRIVVADAGAIYPVRIDPTITDADWVSIEVPDTNGIVRALVSDGTNLYAGGEFTGIGGVAANYIAQWNGSTWSALGSGMSGAVFALAWDGANLYAGGGFTTAGGVSANRIAQWNGSTWSALGSGMTSNVNALVWDGTKLYAGGDFTTAGGVSVNRIALWNGSTWSALGSGIDGSVLALAWDGTRLYAGGTFSIAGGRSANDIAKWNGSAWSALGSGMNNAVRALVWDGTSLYAGGDFTIAGGGSASRIAQWNGSAWSAVGSGVSSTVRALAWDGTKLYVGGSFFTTADGGSANYIAQWDGSTWSTLGSGASGPVYALVWGGTKLTAGGLFFATAGWNANHIAQWDGSTWSPLGSGMSGSVSALAWDGISLYVGGNFYPAGGGNTKHIAQWDGSTWSALGSGMNSSVNSLVWDGTKLTAGGYFTTAGGVSANRIAQWNGSTWSALGSGMNSNVNALAWDGTKLYAGGDFTTAGGVSANRIAQWNGSTWSALGSGMDESVRALVWDGTKLYAGGYFTTAGGGNANRIAKWNGSAWSALGSGVNVMVYALAWDGTNLYAGGNFTTAGGGSAHNIAQWNGSTWSALGGGMIGSGINSFVSALAWDGTNLYAGGLFTIAGGVNANNIAQWNGSTWSALGSGMNRNVSVLAWDGTKLYAGGGFTSAGWKSASVAYVQLKHTVMASAGANGSISPAGATVDHAATTTFVVTPDNGYQIADVTGCGGSLAGSTYTTAPVTVDCTVSVTFKPISFTVGTAIIGSNGTLSCDSPVAPGNTSPCTATPSSGYHLTSISGCGSGTLDGNIYTTAAINADCTVTAAFALNLDTYALTITKSGAGSGTVTSSPAGISCGDTCSGIYDDGTLVTLNATPAVGSVFTGWSGACSGADTCTVTMNAVKGVIVAFDLLPQVAVPGAMTVPTTDPDRTYKVTWGTSATVGVTYVLQESTSSDFTTDLQTIYSGISRSYIVTDRNFATRYYYRVKATKADYTDSAWTVAANSCDLPVAPPGLVTAPNADADGSYSVSWVASATPGVTYTLSEASDSAFTVGLRKAYEGPDLNVELTGRAQGKTYYYRVRASLTGLPSSAWKIRLKGCAVPGSVLVATPGVPLVPATDSDGNFTISWTPSATADVTYELQQATNSAFNVGAFIAYRGPATTVDLTGRAAGKTFYYRVRAIKAGLEDSNFKAAANGCLVGP